MLLDRKLDAKEKKAKDFLALSVNMLGYTSDMYSKMKRMILCIHG